MSATPTEDDMRDLSPQDYLELKAFLEKRRWFEDKLSVLDAKQPIYPFVHLELRSSVDAGRVYERTGEAGSVWKLPNREEVLRWKDERAELEAEVLAFDGGDLGRMKHKTREITLVFLSPPATHLVSITLDLIVLVDQLLHLLRRRQHLLELVDLRLQWDTLRWKGTQELLVLQAELGTSKAIDWSGEESKAIAETEAEQCRLSALLVRLEGAWKTAEASGEMLDGMIEQARSGTDWGSEHGPTETAATEEDAAGQGAVPEALLIAQEELEDGIKRLQDRAQREIAQHSEVLDKWKLVLGWRHTLKQSEMLLEPLLSSLQGQAAGMPRYCLSIAPEDYASLDVHAAQLLDDFERASVVSANATRALSQAAMAVLDFTKVTGRALGGDSILDDPRDAVSKLCRQIAAEGRRIKEYRQHLPIARSLAEACAQAQSDLERLHTAVVRHLPRSSWTPGAIMAPAAAEISRQASVIASHHRTRFVDELGRVEHRFANQGDFLRQLSDASSGFGERLRITRNLIRLIEGCEVQAEVVRNVQLEADALRRRLMEAIEAKRYNASLVQEANIWESGLADRVPFLSESELLVGVIAVALLDPSTSVAKPPPTPPLSRPSSITRRRSASEDGACAVPMDIAAVNAAVRQEINLQAAMVASAVKRLQTLDKDEQRRLKRIQDRLVALHIESLAFPKPEDMRSAPVMLNLPSEPQVAEISRAVEMLDAELQGMREGGSTTQGLAEADAAMHRARLRLPRLAASAAVHTVAARCDQTFSQLLHAFDGRDSPDRDDQITRAENAASAAVASLQEGQAFVESDPRSQTKAKRIMQTLEELAGMRRTPLASDRPSDEGTDESGAIGPPSTELLSAQPATRVSKPPTRTVTQPLRAGARSTSNPFQLGSYSRPTSASRNRSVSSSTLPRLRTDSMRLSGGMGGMLGLQPRAGTMSRVALPKTRVSLSAMADATPRRRVSSMAASTPKLRDRATYVPDPSSRLDVAVGRIVNKLGVDVPVTAVSPDLDEDWKDESGRYWIGAEGRAKLCFCRILRSRTVMVRVGGGWVELSKFLRDHFAETFAHVQPAEQSTVHIGSQDPIIITAASVASAAGSTPTRPRQVSQSRRLRPSATSTPVKMLSGVSGREDPYVTPPKSSMSTSQSTSPAGVLSPRSPLTPGSVSPLVPLQFIKKAGDSPPVWLKEKERLHTGRRSILGKQASPQPQAP